VVAVTATLLALLAALPGALPARAATAAPARSGQSAASGTGLADVAVLDVVMLVDESGSETPDKVAAERQTAGMIVQSMLNPKSRVTVVGFGGRNGLAPNQNPVDVVCQPTIAGGQQNLGYLASCVSKLHRRGPQEGDDTDYAAALGQAMGYFDPASTYGRQSPAKAIKVIFMMTDGAVDVSRDPNYTAHGQSWQVGEQQAVNLQLAAAKSDGVQVWPLGFGTAITPSATDYLNKIAAGGAQATACGNRAVSQPHATVVTNPTDAINALDELYGDAACIGEGHDHAILTNHATLKLTIPPIASNAAISVDRADPGVQVTFTRPDGSQWTDSTAISGAANSPVEVLHLNQITNGDVGPWQVNLSAPPGLKSQLVSATVFWQGAVRAIMTADPSQAKLGQPIRVTLSLLGPEGPITDPGTLKSLVAGVVATGDGLPGPTRVNVSNAGEPAGSVTGVADYKGTFQAPNQAGALTFTGTAAGYGLYATQFPASVAVTTAVQDFSVTPQFPVVNSVQSGSSITGQLIATNKTGSARHVRLVLDKSGADASLTSPPVVTVPSGNPPSVPFTIAIAKDSRPGPAWLEVRAIDPSTGQQLSQAQLTLAVTRPPGFFDKYKWLILAVIVAAILIGLAGYQRRKAARDAKDVQDLIAVLSRNGNQLSELRAPSKRSDAFRFTIRDEAETTAMLAHPEPGFVEYMVTRSRFKGEVKLYTPSGGEPYDAVVDGQPEVVDKYGNEIAVRVRPGRKLRGGKVRKSGMLRRSASPATPGRGGLPAAGVAGAAGYGPGQPAHDDWYGPGPAGGPAAPVPSAPTPGSAPGGPPGAPPSPGYDPADPYATPTISYPSPNYQQPPADKDPWL
jgi:von Willebrand factor type A domain